LLPAVSFWMYHVSKRSASTSTLRTPSLYM
jgi:uncharacterized membrane protein YsdA (DUF1294 family)